MSPFAAGQTIRSRLGSGGTAALNSLDKDARQIALVVTAELPAALQARAEALRRAHYPAARNRVPAHATLLRALPPFAESEARQHLAALAAEIAPPTAVLTGVMDLGTGTALAIASDALEDVRAMIAQHWHGMLTLQDQGTPRLHVTVQNKVTRREAIALQEALGQEMRTERFAFAALALHRYRGGVWEAAGRWPFRGRVRR